MWLTLCSKSALHKLGHRVKKPSVEDGGDVGNWRWRIKDEGWRMEEAQRIRKREMSLVE
jgi:hypothetical protein